MAKKPAHHESQLQIQCVSWFRYMYPHLSPLFFAVPNGGKRNKAEAAIMKAEGITAGVSDLILNIPSGRYTQLAIEMKDCTGTQSSAQKRYQRYAQTVGIKYIICRDFGTFTVQVKDYLESVCPLVIDELRKLHAEDKEAEIQEARRLYQKRCCNTTKRKTA